MKSIVMARKYKAPWFGSTIIVVAVLALSSCGSKSNTASPTPSSTSSSNVSTTPTASPAVQAGLTCQSDKSSDSINVGKYFGNILAQVKKQWKSDAVISSVRFDRQYAKNFEDLCTLKTDSNWQMIFYSLGTKKEIAGYLDNGKKDSTGTPPMIFTAIKVDNSMSTSLTYAEMKKQGGWTFSEFSRPETFAYESKYAANPFLNWKMSMSEVVQKLIDRVKDEKITGAGFNVLIGKASTKTRTPFVYIYWQNSPAKTAFYVEPVKQISYDIKY